MHILTEWDNEEHTIMRVTYQPGWTWDDMEANMPTEQSFLDSVDHSVDVIADFRDTELPAGAVSRLPAIAKSPPYTHRNSGNMVMVGSPFFMDEVVSVYRVIYGSAARKLTMVGTLEEARELIAQKRAEQVAKAADNPQEPDDSPST